MQLIAADRADRRHAVVPILAGGIAGTALIVAGLALAYAAYGTPLMAQLIPDGRPSAAQGTMGMVAWAVALIAPAALLLLGTNRLATMLARLRRGKGAAHRRAATLPDGVAVALKVNIGDGRVIPELYVGPFGAVVVRDVPPSKAVRSRGQSWEVFTSDGWVRIENPVDAATRDAERIRRWFAQEDRDFVVRVYAAVIDQDGSTPRTPGCAVVTEAQLTSWLASLPPQRTLTAGRRSHILATVRDAV
jgi:hypothetical protein